MRFKDLITEAPMVDYDMIGDPNTEGSFRLDDLAAMRNPKWLQKVETGFSRTPYDIALYLFNAPEEEIDFGNGQPKNVRYFEHLRKHLFGGMGNELDRQRIKFLVDKTNVRLKGRITVIMVENEGGGRLRLTPWIIAHRICHCLEFAGSVNSQIKAFTDVFHGLLDLVPVPEEEFVNKDGLNLGTIGQHQFQAAKLFGTMQSARDGNYFNPADFETELMTQFLYSGRITLNRPKIHDDEQQTALEQSISELEVEFNDAAKAIFDAAVGRAFVL